MLTLQALAAGCTVNTLVAMGEEAGWRGFLHRELQPLGFWRSSAFTGVVWGLWHAPLIVQGHNYPQHPMAGVALMVVFTTLLAPLLAWVRRESQSTWGPALAHGVLNGSAGLALVLLRGGDDLTVGVTGLSGLTVLTLANLALWKLDPPQDA
jgi:membrane protease YdiL (CAAX protease family)